jgi:hypothetical protein
MLLLRRFPEMVSHRLFPLVMMFLVLAIGCENLAKRPVTPEEKAYLPNIEVTNPQMSMATNDLHQVVYFMDAVITNHGDKRVRRVVLELTFVDAQGQMVRVDKVWPYSIQRIPLQPHERRAFQEGFEHLPPTWNRGAPKIKVTVCQF